MSDIIGPANAANAVTVRPAETRSFLSLDTWFKDCSGPLADDGTSVEASWLNGMLAWSRAIWRGNGNRLDGVTPVVPEFGTDDAGVLKAIQQLIQRGQTNYAADTGTANAMVVSLVPAAVELKSGLIVRAKKSAASNTGATTLSLNGFAAKPVLRADLTALQRLDLVANAPFEAVYDGWVDAFILVNFTGGQQTAPYADVSVFTTSGNIAVPHAVNTITPFTGATIGANGDVSNSSGACLAGRSGKYIIHVNEIAGSVSGTDAIAGMSSAFIFKNGVTQVVGTGWQNTNTGSTYIKEVYGANTWVVDLAAGDTVSIGIRQVNSAASTTLLTYSGQMSISKVH